MDKIQSESEHKTLEAVLLKGVIPVIQSIAAIVSKVGLPGSMFSLIAYIFVKYGTDSQKIEFVDLFILWKWTDRSILDWLIPIFFLSFILVQRYYYKNKLKIKDDEINRLGNSKSKTQFQKIGKPLTSSSNKKRKGG